MKEPSESPQNRILRMPAMEEKLGLACPTIYAKFTPNPNRPGDFDPTFPKPIKLGPKAVGWVETEVDAWIEAQIAKRDSRDLREGQL